MVDAISTDNLAENFVMPIQDNLNGALLISAIDFILSFVIIGGIGLILAAFPLLNRFGKLDDEDLKKHH